MKQTAIFLSALMLVGCNQEAKHDSAMLDSQLAVIHIDRVEFVSWDRETTNVISGQTAQNILASLAPTNRTSCNEIKDKVRRVYFMNGTKMVLDMSLTENGTWRYGAYRFALRTEAH